VEPRSDSNRAVAAQPAPSAIGALLKALTEAKIRFQIVGMTAAILQGVPAATLDADIWIDLPERQYMRAINIAVRLDAKPLRQTVVVLRDESLVNFCYRIDGVRSFDTEYRNARWIEWEGVRVKVLSLERIIKSKEAAGREKDIAILPHLRKIAESRKKLRLRR
jgi:predicted nucleotidyltransferase